MPGMWRQRKVGKGSGVTEKIDLFVALPIVGAFFALLFIMVSYDLTPDLAVKANMLFMLMLCGIVIRLGAWALFKQSITFGGEMSMGKVALMMFSVGMMVATLGAIYRYALLPYFAPDFPAAATITMKQMFLTVAGVAEELFWIWAVFLPMTLFFGKMPILGLPGWAIAMPLSGALFAAYHVYVYQTRPDLMLMFVYRVSFCFAYMASGWFMKQRSIAIPIWAHAIINFTSAGQIP